MSKYKNMMEKVKELQSFYKKYVIEMDVKFKQFKRKNT